VTARHLTLGVVQAAFGDNLRANIASATRLVREAAGKGAQVILVPELFQGPYFCVRQEERWFAAAHPWREHPCVAALAPLAGELGVVLPISIFEREGPHYFNSLVMADANGALLGVYRKSHIPDGPGYQEKYYFRPGDTGFRVWPTRFGRIGVGVCWDQWYPEAARAMALMGADALLYPTAIGSEPHDPSLDTALPWRRAMQGHAVANAIPVAGANRTGFEPWPDYPGGGQRFYGSSFICDHRGDLIADLGRDEEAVGLATFDLDFLDGHRAAWGFFRDRRPDLYGALTAPRPA
jgi:N-carbamoylputrescine amidase